MQTQRFFKTDWPSRMNACQNHGMPCFGFGVAAFGMVVGQGHIPWIVKVQAPQGIAGGSFVTGIMQRLVYWFAVQGRKKRAQEQTLSTGCGRLPIPTLSCMIVGE